MAELVVGGLASGSLYAVLGIGLILVLQTTDIPNFAQGEMAMISTFVAYSLLTEYELAWWAAVSVALVFAAVQGLVVYQLVLRPLLGAPVLSAVIATLGLNIALHSLAGMIWGNQTHVFPSPFSTMLPVRVGTVVLAAENLVTILVSVALVVVLSLVLKTTRAGVALRAASQNRSVARLMGIPVDRAFAVAWVFGSVAGAVAGILVAPVLFLDTNLMGNLLIKAFAGAVLGGLNSLAGTFLGGLALGVLENLVGAYLSGSYRDALAFLVIIVVLLVAPEGVFGRARAKRV